ncbi:MAG: pentapeptide repeat-containing protein [Desulfarculaceae bacterium]|nr:pentapeptide repeat-containing protein [Desulfarculaceae bacterium]
MKTSLVGIVLSLLVSLVIPIMVFAESAQPKFVVMLGNGRKLTESQLKKMLDKHYQWIWSDKKSGAQANFTGAILEDVDLTRAFLEGAKFNNTLFNRVLLKGISFQDTVFVKCKFQDSDLSDTFFVNSKFEDSVFSNTKLTNAFFKKVTANNCNYIMCDLTMTALNQTNFNKSMFHEVLWYRAKISSATFAGTVITKNKFKECFIDRGNVRTPDDLEYEVDFSKAFFVDNDFEGTALDIINEKIPNISFLASTHNLDLLTYRLFPVCLIKLRNLAFSSGLSTQERQLTYAIMRNDRKKNYGHFEGLVAYVIFELPSGWGMNPGRPLSIMLFLIPFFAVAYWFALRGTDGDGIYRVWSPTRILKKPEEEGVERLGAGKAWRNALYFSILSAFHIGWRDLNVGNWISRMQPREYTLRATGWVRVVSGIQSLISVYLLALAVLTYFGRPFG